VQMKAASVRKSAKEKSQAEELAKQFEGLSATFRKRAGEHDQLFGSVTSGDIADAIVKKGINLDRKQIQLHEPLKTLGEFTVPVKLHKDVTAHLKVVIEKEAVAE
jgi:large subunit ribosomal protein L9